MPAPTPADDDAAPVISDDVWDLFLHDSETRIRASAPKEPSARARVTARLPWQRPESAARARRADRVLAALRAALVVAVVAALALLTLSPTTALAWVDGAGTRPARTSVRPAGPAHRPGPRGTGATALRCRAGAVRPGGAAVRPGRACGAQDGSPRPRPASGAPSRE